MPTGKFSLVSDLKAQVDLHRANISWRRQEYFVGSHPEFASPWYHSAPLIAIFVNGWIMAL